MLIIDALWRNGSAAAGEGVTGDVFKCSLKPVARALQDGTYDTVRFDVSQIRRLREIFPQGVCDYAQK